MQTAAMQTATADSTSSGLAASAASVNSESAGGSASCGQTTCEPGPHVTSRSSDQQTLCATDMGSQSARGPDVSEPMSPCGGLAASAAACAGSAGSSASCGQTPCGPGPHVTSRSSDQRTLCTTDMGSQSARGPDVSEPMSPCGTCGPFAVSTLLDIAEKDAETRCVNTHARLTTEHEERLRCSEYLGTPCRRHVPPRRRPRRSPLQCHEHELGQAVGLRHHPRRPGVRGLRQAEHGLPTVHPQ